MIWVGVKISNSILFRFQKENYYCFGMEIFVNIFGGTLLIWTINFFFYNQLLVHV